MPTLPLNDFEDAMQCASVMACDADVIVSRNIKDYQHSPIRALTPEQCLMELKEQRFIQDDMDWGLHGSD
ncbi:PIN domain-containing protein [Methylovulum miyakonense]|uniref:hypothetical protein n=1 Tax=Methylovulum miyakonense TaxID=645578 RepID=UPI0012EC17E2|nr:hypothetical protein [Methylovulum miyakonense]